MARKYGNRSSTRGIRNLGSAANGIGKAAAKGIAGTAKWMATDHTGTTEFTLRQSTFIESMWGIYSIMASSNLRFRRFDRSLKQHNRLMNGEETSVIEIAYGWIIDHLLFLWDTVLIPYRKTRHYVALVWRFSVQLRLAAFPCIPRKLDRKRFIAGRLVRHTGQLQKAVEILRFRQSKMRILCAAGSAFCVRLKASRI